MKHLLLSQRQRKCREHSTSLFFAFVDKNQNYINFPGSKRKRRSSFNHTNCQIRQKTSRYHADVSGLCFPSPAAYRLRWCRSCVAHYLLGALKTLPNSAKWLPAIGGCVASEVTFCVSPHSQFVAGVLYCHRIGGM